MANSLGVSQDTWAPLTDWDHVVQSIRIILKTPIGSRVMRREFGSELPELLDRAMTDANILAVYVATAVAIAKWEPRFRLEAVKVQDAQPTGRIGLALFGQYLPRGHLGDDTPARPGTEQLTVTFG